jgi:hypothetical protein
MVVAVNEGDRLISENQLTGSLPELRSGLATEMGEM